MKLSSLLYFAGFGLRTILLRRSDPIVGTVILTDKCNLHCKHCSVNNRTATIQPYARVKADMETLFRMGVRILFFCGGETFLWSDDGRTLRDLVLEARRMGFRIVNVVTNGTLSADLPEADLVLLSLDGDRERHNKIRGDTYDTILANVAAAPAGNVCLYMAINRINRDCVRHVCRLARDTPHVRAVSFNFHTPYPDTAGLALTTEQKRACCADIASMMDEGAPVFNLRSVLPYVAEGRFPAPCRQCVVVEGGRLSVCGRCIDVPGLCEKCGYFFVAEYTLAFRGRPRIVLDMLRTYTRYV